MKALRPLAGLQKKESSGARPPGYVKRCLELGTLDTGTGLVHFSHENWLTLRHEFSKPLPGLLTQAKNAAAAAGRAMTAAATNQPVTVPDAEFQRRMTICAACEFLDKSTQRCGKCGCYVAAAVIGKARLATEKCPINRWVASK